MRFVSEVDVVAEERNELFNAISIYIPLSLAADNIVDFEESTVTATKPYVETCVLANYKNIMKGDLLDKWQPIFRQDTNNSVILYLIVFLDGTSTSSMWEIGQSFIKFAPITNAFSKLYFISYIKVLYDTTRDGNTNALYFDMSLALAYQCKQDLKLSYFLSLVRVVLPLASGTDTNKCWVCSKTMQEELEAATGLNVAITGVTPRDAYYWGMLRYMQCINTSIMVHSEPADILVQVLADWFRGRNDSGQFVGNKMSKIRLTGDLIKPLGWPSWLNSAVNENAGDPIFTILRDKHVGFLKTISDNTPQESALQSMVSVTGMPTIALMIAKFVDYQSAQDCAKMLTDRGTLVDPVLKNEETYLDIQAIVLRNLQLFTGTQRLVNIQMKFPSYGALPPSKTDITAASAWQARYEDDLGGVFVSGGITA
jgi:hypothetical protein